VDLNYLLTYFCADTRPCEKYFVCYTHRENGLDFMSFRFWIGFWVMVALLVIVAFDLSALVRYITRFTEESFSILISVIFIYEAFMKVSEIWSDSPVHTGIIREDISRPWLYQCHCIPVPKWDNFSRPNLTTDALWKSTLGYTTSSVTGKYFGRPT